MNTNLIQQRSEVRCNRVFFFFVRLSNRRLTLTRVSRLVSS